MGEYEKPPFHAAAGCAVQAPSGVRGDVGGGLVGPEGIRNGEFTFETQSLRVPQ